MEKILLGGLFIVCSVGLSLAIMKLVKMERSAKEKLSYGVEGLKGIFDSAPKDIFEMQGFREFLRNFRSARFEMVDNIFADKKYNIFACFDPKNFTDITKLIDDQGVFKLSTCGCPKIGKALIFADFNDCVAKYLVDNKIQSPEFFKIYEQQTKFEKSIQASLGTGINIWFIFLLVTCATVVTVSGIGLFLSCCSEPPSCNFKLFKPKTDQKVLTHQT